MKLPRFWIAPLAFVCFSSNVVGASENNRHLSALKEFLSSDISSFEVVFSVKQYENELIRKEIESYHKQIDNRSMSVSFEPVYYRVRRAEDGFFVHRANSLPEIDSPNFVSRGRSIQGVFSNSFWSASGDLVLVDAAKLKEYEKVGVSWTNLAETALLNSLTFGLPIRRGSLDWNGTHFTAEPSNHKLWGQRSVDGAIKMSNMMPASVVYEVGGSRGRVDFSFEATIPGWPGLPARMTIFQEAPALGVTNRVDLEIVRLVVTNFPANSTAPDEFKKSSLPRIGLEAEERLSPPGE